MLRIIGICLLVLAIAVAVAWQKIDPPRVAAVKEQVFGGGKAGGVGWQASVTEVHMEWNWLFALPLAVCLVSGVACVVISFVPRRVA